MKIAVCDDCYEDALKIKRLLSGHDVRVFLDMEQILSDIQRGSFSFDLYLIDIYMDDTSSGIELAKSIREYDEEVAICFVSSSDDFYREAYDLYAMQYLVKPVAAEDIQRLVGKVSGSIVKNKEQKLYYQWWGQVGTIPYGNVMYINSREHTLYIHCRDGHVQECKGKLDEMAMQICGEVFFRCHQSFIVNMHHVNRMEGNELILGDESVPISRRYYKETKRRYQEVLFENVD